MTFQEVFFGGRGGGAFFTPAVDGPKEKKKHSKFSFSQTTS